MPAFTQTIDVERSAEDTYALALDFRAYRNFVPALKDVEVAGGEEPEVTFTIDAPLGDIRYTVRYTLDPPGSITWDMVSSNVLKGQKGHWRIEPAGPDRARVTYHMDTRLPAYLSWAVTDKAYAEQIGKTVQRFKAYAESS